MKKSPTTDVVIDWVIKNNDKKQTKKGGIAVRPFLLD